MTYIFTEHQIGLHKKALKVLSDIQECRSFFDFDQEYLGQKIAEYRKQYAQIMEELMAPAVERGMTNVTAA